MYVCMYIYIHYVCMYVCIYISYIFTYIHIYIYTLLCLIVRRGGSNKMHQGENYQDFLKWEVVFRSFSCKY